MTSSSKTTMQVRECEIVYRARRVEAVPRRIVSSEDVYRLLGAIGAAQRVTESIWVLLLDARQKVIALHECARGGVANVNVELTNLFRAAVIAGSHAIILAHNHPSGECAPSTEDDAFTARARAAGQLLGITVLDHVVVSTEGYFSFADAGQWPRFADVCRSPHVAEGDLPSALPR